MAFSVLFTAAGCDSDDPDTLVFDGVEIEARGQAELATEGGLLLVSNVGDGGDDGFFIRGTPTSVDVFTEPIPIEAGQGFGISVIAEDGEVLAGFKNRNRGASTDPFTFEITFADRLDVTAVRVTYLLDGRIQLDVPSLPFDVGGSRLRLGTDGVGQGEGDTNSAHVVRRGGKYVVVSDAEEQQQRRADAKGECPGFVVTLPAGVEFDSPTLCADRIEVEPLNVTFPETIAGVAVTGRSLGTFRVRSLAAR